MVTKSPEELKAMSKAERKAYYAELKIHEAQQVEEAQLAANRKAAMDEEAAEKLKAIEDAKPKVAFVEELPGTPAAQATPVITEGTKRPPSVDPSKTIQLLVTSNPKRPSGKSFARFQLYFNDGVKTVGDALKAGVTAADIKWDTSHGFITLK